MREYRNRICSAVLAAVCVIGTALIPSRAVHAEDVVDPIAVQKQAAYDAVPETNGLENWPQGPHVYANSAIVMEMNVARNLDVRDLIGRMQMVCMMKTIIRRRMTWR